MEEIKKEPVTALLILLNILIFLIVEFTGGSENGQHMLECGACYAPLILEQGEWYRVFLVCFCILARPTLLIIYLCCLYLDSVWNQLWAN